MLRFIFRQISLSVVLICLTAAAIASPRITFERSGTADLENSLVRLSASNHPGSDYGLQSWFFKPINHEMIDVLYGQTDADKGHALGELWDPVNLPGVVGAAPNVGNLYVPVEYGTAPDGSATELVQVTQGDYRLQRTVIMRRDLATLEVRYDLKNISGQPSGFWLRLKSVLSPGARGVYQNKQGDVWLKTEHGILALDQTLSLDQYAKKYGTEEYILPALKEVPRAAWARNASADLAGNWAAQVNRETGDGMAFIADADDLTGFYNAPGITLEPLMRAITLAQGQSWSGHIFITSFTGAKRQKIEQVTPLYVVTSPLNVSGGMLKGKVIPLFQGTLQITNSTGKVMQSLKAAPSKIVSLQADVGKGGWKLIARDTTGALIGSITNTGKVELAEPKIRLDKTPKPMVKTDVYEKPNASQQVTAFLKPRDFVVYADWSAPQQIKEMAHQIALQLGVGLSWTVPEEKSKILAIGIPQNNTVVREEGLLRNSVTASWPGKGKGAILPYDNYEGTEQPVTLITGSDEAGLLHAIGQFKRQYLAKIKQPSGFDFRVVSTSAKVYPYSRPVNLPQEEIQNNQKVLISAAGGEYEAAQLLLTPYESLHDIKVSMAPLVSVATGKEIDKKYITSYRRQRGPLWLRWVRYWPSEPAGGSTGRPDPLLERPVTNLEDGQAQALWLTVIIPENTPAGSYRSSITVEANGQNKTIPIEINVWGFNLPRMALLGDPYMYMQNFPAKRGDMNQSQVNALVQNLVEHDMRVIHLKSSNMFRWHFSPTGAYKGKGTDRLEVSADGTVALDTSYFDKLVNWSDSAAAPFPLRYMVYQLDVASVADVGDFKRAFPHRFDDKPTRGGNTVLQSYYTQEMLQLYKQHLEKKGLMSRCVLKISDEPRGFNYWYDSFTEAARAVGLPMMTAFNTMDYAEAEQKITSVAQWEVLYQISNADFLKKAQKAGTLVSWYNDGPPPRTSASASASEIRAYLWQAAKANLDLISWWGIQNWPDNNTDVWRDRYSSWNSVMYPVDPQSPPWIEAGKGWKDEAPIDSIRWELIREGMEDAKYVYLLRDLIAQARVKNLTTDADNAQGLLDSIWKSTYPTLNDYHPDYAVIYQQRHQVAQEIVDLQAKLGTAQIK